MSVPPPIQMTVQSSASSELIPQVVAAAREALWREIAELTATVKEFPIDSADAVDGTPFHKDTATSNHAVPHKQRSHRRRVWRMALDEPQLIAVNVLDHIRAQSQIISNGSPPLYAHMTLSRVASEGAARICYLLDPRASYEVRILRSAAMLKTSADSDVKAIRNLPDSYPLKPMLLEANHKELAALTGLFDRAGITLRCSSKNQATHLQFSTPVVAVPLQLKLTDLVESQFEELPAWYRITSGVVHSANWSLSERAAVPPNSSEFEFRPSILSIGVAAQSCIGACAAIKRAYAQYYGYDSELAIRSSERRHHILDVLMRDHSKA